MDHLQYISPVVHNPDYCNKSSNWFLTFTTGSWKGGSTTGLRHPIVTGLRRVTWHKKDQKRNLQKHTDRFTLFMYYTNLYQHL
jgi:hypothetical protein